MKSIQLLLFFLTFFSLNIECNFLIITIPKSGTHLLLKALAFLTDAKPRKTKHIEFFFEDDFIYEPNTYIQALHQPASVANRALVQRHNLPVIFLIRDPRDQLISSIYWIEKHKEKHGFSLLENLSKENAITMILSDYRTFNINPTALRCRTIKDFYYSYLGWTTYSRTLTVRFEDLVGSKGGGNDEKQKETLKAIAQHIGVKLENEKLEYIANNLFGISDGCRPKTFRSGQIGSWKNHFTPEHKRLFKQTTGNLLIKLGYEKDDNW